MQQIVLLSGWKRLRNYNQSCCHCRTVFDFYLLCKISNPCSDISFPNWGRTLVCKVTSDILDMCLGLANMATFRIPSNLPVTKVLNINQQTVLLVFLIEPSTAGCDIFSEISIKHPLWDPKFYFNVKFCLPTFAYQWLANPNRGMFNVVNLMGCLVFFNFFCKDL
jgi:hypothetical protein